MNNITYDQLTEWLEKILRTNKSDLTYQDNLILDLYNFYKKDKIQTMNAYNKTMNDTPVQQKPPISHIIRERIQQAKARFYSNDNISEFIEEGEKDDLISELTEKFNSVLDTLLIDRENDPNAMDTGKRLAKMYINELMAGRYNKTPEITSFPNVDENRFTGMLCAKVELKSICSHHHQPVTIDGWIGIIPGTKVIGLSKYTRLAQHLARRGTLQEELTKDILDAIIKDTGTDDVAVVLKGRHGCMENRGCMSHNSTTVTSLVSGMFFVPGIKSEFLEYIRDNR